MMEMLDGSFIWILLGLGVLFAVGGVLLKLFIIGVAAKAIVNHLQLYNQEAQKMQALLLQAQTANPGQLTGQVGQQMSAQWLKMQNELRHLDSIQRQQSELNMASMRSQAAELGVFLD